MHSIDETEMYWNVVDNNNPTKKHHIAQYSQVSKHSA